MLTYKYYRFPTQGDIPNIDEWPEGVSVDIVGRLIHDSGVYDEKGVQLREPIFKDGWHVNVCYQGNKDLSFVKKYEITVKTPNRTWLGQSS